MRNLLFKYKYLIITLLFSIMLLLFFHGYRDTKNMMEESNKIQRAMVERNILESFSYADSTYKILEEHLNKDMKKYSKVLVDKYKQNPHIYSWDLEKIKEKFHGYDIYIIDKNLEVKRTTFKKDLELDFDQFPNFADLLRKRMSGDIFHADRMDISTNAHKIVKYSYMPSPDNKYLFELSTNILETHPLMKNINVFSHANELTNKYDLVKKISFYKFSETGSEVGIVTRGEGPYIDKDISNKVKDIVENTVLSNKSIEITKDNSPGANYTYKYIPYLNYSKHDELDWWNSYVVGITYDDSILQSKLAAERNLFIGKTVIITLVFILFAFIMVYLIKRTEQLASCDCLTALPNRKRYEEHFNKIVSQRKDERAAVLFIDLDDFKAINDTYGHETGDLVIKKAAEILKSNVREDDMITRAGGDEFLVLLTGITSPADAESAVKKIMQALKITLVVDNKTINVRASTGMSIYPDDGTTLQELLRKADHAMYSAKR
ncbi:MAG: GGDEF domain-containing protein [Clostridiales bacterium]|nr:GGDEF domain-containing protein [Clostridiales bacterium]MCF8022775.1 GGDEF domain-containing protein [Clostridiales bacterium]